MRDAGREAGVRRVSAGRAGVHAGGTGKEVPEVAGHGDPAVVEGVWAREESLRGMVFLSE